ncbi:MAG: hypothetical protein AB1757_06795 [Acidobacteriota bacterium]
MTGSQILEKFHNLIGDDLGADFELQLANDAKNSIETELELEITKKLNSSLSTSAGQTYTTSRALPSDFLSPLVIRVGTQKVYPIPFEAQIDYREISGYYWIDLANDVFYLTGTQGSAQTIYFFYQRETDDLTTATSPIWPTRFHSLIPYEMARKYFAIDAGEKGRSWSPEMQLYYTELKNQMIQWDHKLKLNGMDNSTTPFDAALSSENRVPI